MIRLNIGLILINGIRFAFCLRSISQLSLWTKLFVLHAYMIDLDIWFLIKK